MDFFKSLKELLGYLHSKKIDDLKLTNIQFTELLRKKKLLDKRTIGESQKHTEYYRNQIKHQEFFEGVIGLMNNYSRKEVIMFLDSLVRNSYLSLRTVAVNNRKPYFTLRFEKEKFEFLMQYLQSCDSSQHTYVLPIPENDRDDLDWENLPNDTQLGNDFIFDHIPAKPLIPIAASDLKPSMGPLDRPKQFSFTIEGVGDTFLSYISEELKRRLQFLIKMFPSTQTVDLDWIVDHMPISSTEHWLGKGERTNEVIYMEIKSFITTFQIRRKDAKWHNTANEKAPIMQVPLNPSLPSWGVGLSTDSTSDTSKPSSVPPPEPTWSVRPYVPTMNIEIDLEIGLEEPMEPVKVAQKPVIPATQQMHSQQRIPGPDWPQTQTTVMSSANITKSSVLVPKVAEAPNTKPIFNYQILQQTAPDAQLVRRMVVETSRRDSQTIQTTTAFPKKAQELVSPFGAQASAGYAVREDESTAARKPVEPQKGNRRGTFENSGFDPKYDASNFKETQKLSVNSFNPSKSIFVGHHTELDQLCKKRNQDVLQNRESL